MDGMVILCALLSVIIQVIHAGSDVQNGKSNREGGNNNQGGNGQNDRPPDGSPGGNNDQPPDPGKNNGNPEEDDSENTGLLIGLGVGILALVIGILIIMAVWLKYRKRSEHQHSYELKKTGKDNPGYGTIDSEEKAKITDDHQKNQNEYTTYEPKKYEYTENTETNTYEELDQEYGLHQYQDLEKGRSQRNPPISPSPPPVPERPGRTVNAEKGGYMDMNGKHEYVNEKKMPQLPRQPSSDELVQELQEYHPYLEPVD